MKLVAIVLMVVATVFLLAILGGCTVFMNDLGHDCQQAQNC
jgi:hypothetical protein